MTNPYKDFGVALRAFRVAAKESLEDVSGAIEIEPDKLARFEKGEELPNTDLLNLLVTHFSLREGEAARLWELAGYDEDETSGLFKMPLEVMKLTVQVVDPNQIAFTDSVKVATNDYGVIVSFAQQTGENFKVISKLGMSKAHAREVARALEEALEEQSQPEQG